MEPREETIRRLSEQFGFVSHLMRHQFRSGELRHGERGILRCMRYHAGEGELRPSQISALMGVQQSTVTPQLRSLEERGYLHRRHGSEDRREVYYALTDRAHVLYETERARTADFFNGLYDALGPQDSALLAALLERAADYVLEQEPKERGEHHA